MSNPVVVKAGRNSFHRYLVTKDDGESVVQFMPTTSTVEDVIEKVEKADGVKVIRVEQYVDAGLTTVWADYVKQAYR